MSTNRRKSVLLFAAGLFAVSAAACQTTLDDARLEQVITEGIESQTAATVTSVDCPDDRPLQQGDTFTCSAVSDLGLLQITVTQTDDQGNVNWEITGQT